MPSYRVQFRAQGAGSWSDGPLVDTGGSRSGETIVTGLTNGTTYEFRVVRSSSGVASRNTLAATPAAAFESNLGGVEASASSGGDAIQVGTFGGVRGVLVSLANNGNTFTVSYDNGSGWVEFGSKEGGNKLSAGASSQGSRSFFFPFPADVSGITSVRVVVSQNGGNSNSMTATLV